jgi:hypothetical protein
MAIEKVQLPKEEFTTPPAAKPSFSGLPLPTGRPIRPEFLTEMERKTLDSLGWKDGDPVPTNLADAIKRVKDSLDPTTLPPPVSLDTPKLVIPDSVAIEDLPEDKRNEIKQFLARTNDVKQAIGASTSAGNVPMQKPGAGLAESSIEVVNDLGQKKDLASANKSTETGTTGLSITHCPQCHHDLSLSGVEDPDEDTRMWYLQALIGQKPFEKTFPIMGGAVTIVLRALDIDQVDHVYQTVGQEKLDNPRMNENDFFEKIRRYKLALQLKLIGFSDGTGAEFPDDKKPNLSQLFELVHQKAIKNESMARLLVEVQTKFNRLLAKLEACAERPDFWPVASAT